MRTLQGYSNLLALLGCFATTWLRANGQSLTGLGLGPAQFPSQSLAFGVSADGQNVSGHYYASSGHIAFLWTRSGGMVSVGTFSGDTVSLGWTVSGNGLVVAGASQPDDFHRHAFRWSATTGIVPVS